jgi:hypothetical protein
MAIFQAYFDESGKLADKEFVVFAACVATIADWESFSIKWTEMLGDIGYVHMTEAVRCEGEFKRFRGKESDRDDLLVALAELAVARYAFSVHIPVKSATFKELPANLQTQLKDPVYCGFEGLLRNLLESASRIQATSGIKYSHGFQLYADASTDYSVQILKLYHRVKSVEQDARERFQSITFAEDEHFPPLQAADMLAYCRRCEESNDAWRPVVKKLLDVFNRNGSLGNMELVYKADCRGLGHGFLDNPH